MAARESLPGEFTLDAIVIAPNARLVEVQGDPHDYGQPGRPDADAWGRARERGPYVSLRWVLNPALGIPVEPFVVWRRSAGLREVPTPISGLQRTGSTYTWGGVREMLQLRVTLSAPTTVTSLHRADLRPVESVSGNAGDVLVLEAGPVLGLRADNPGAVASIEGLSLVDMANGDGWEMLEVVGLPFTPEQMAGTYYRGEKQGPAGALTDPFEAAALRLHQWAPLLGWTPLSGLDPWVAPDPKGLVLEAQEDLLAALAEVLAAHPAPMVAGQLNAQVTRKLAELAQVIGPRRRAMNTGAAADRAELSVRPLQALSMAVATDTWSSLTLGFGTGDAPTGRGAWFTDYMVTTRWVGMLRRAIPPMFPFPQADLLPTYVEVPAERELAAIVLTPRPRPAPPAATGVRTRVGHDEGADALDAPYHASIVLTADRPDAAPREPRATGYALARYDKPGAGDYRLRRHPLAGGWYPISSATPIQPPGTPPDPANPPGLVTLRDSGVTRPITGAATTQQYYVAATDLFGQWSPWSTAWSTLDAAGVQAPVIAGVQARASGAADPCGVRVVTEFVWDRRERTLGRLDVLVQAYDPPPPPAAIPAPPDVPSAMASTLAAFTVDFAADGTPTTPGVDILAVHEDGTPVTATSPGDPHETRYRLVLTDLPLTYAGRPEVAVATYLRATETIRPGEWSPWSHSREAAVAPNPIPPPPPTPLPAVYPRWASLPDPAGLSSAVVDWAPVGVWRYRVYEATEAALRAACGLPGPVLTDDLGSRMQALFDLYRDPANLPKLKAAYRKLGSEPVSPPVVAGRMSYRAPLPRGSGLIHCFVVVGVTESNVTSAWPVPDGDGRRGFDAFAIPHLRRPVQPQLRGRLDPDTGIPELTVRLDGAVAATRLRLYRASNAILARSVGTMTLVGEYPVGVIGPEYWRLTVLTDPGAAPSWSRLQYRVVALTDDDPATAGTAVPSAPSSSYALLKAPTDPPTLTLTPNVPGTTDTVSLVRVDTDVPKRTDIGDSTLACTSTPVAPRLPFASSLATIPTFATPAALVASTEVAGDVGGVLHLRLDRAPGQELAVGVDVTDPLGRSTHGLVVVPGEVPDPVPLVTLTGGRAAGVVRLRIDTNAPPTVGPAHEWTVRITGGRVFPFPSKMALRLTLPLSTIPTITSEAAMPDPTLDPSPYEVRRIGGLILVWFRQIVPVSVSVVVTNSLGQSTTANGGF